ncbi:hypothetical protein C8A05DRAFT_14116 [Staphylotrichum tortipilum]|uniref:Cytochrome oxidase c assembly-domain-containing protein n=1 Tax=Staphylotrichum tortipilum TaxID=2831512 RepID=A0AAN6RVU8_9PEZI|nr:hypothetical protein C8A05DRAFT_14116 [Staphylotrichum longicolle]
MKPAIRLAAAPRSVPDATRFTATTVHAASKTATPPGRFAAPKAGPAPSSPLLETPEQKVARLRAAHRRAKAAEVSQLDRFIDTSRRFLDSGHKVTIIGIIIFTIIAGCATAYTAVDMILYNKKRSAEWLDAQKKLEADSLDAARIAYMTGKATEEQIELVEEQLERERQSGEKKSFFNALPSVLGAPSAAGASSSADASTPSSSPSSPPTTSSPPHGVTETISWSTTTSPQQQPDESEKKKTSLWGWLTSNLKREEEGEAGDDAAPSRQRRLGLESLSEEDDGACVPDSAIVRAVEEKRARKLAEAEAKGQAVGADAGKEEVVKKKGWLW